MPSDPKPAKRVRDPGFMKAVRTMQCSVMTNWWHTDFPDPGPCSSEIQAAHVGQRGKSRKCNDDETIPLCGYHHMRLDNCLGGSLFDTGNGAAATKDGRRAWLIDQISRVQTFVHNRRIFEEYISKHGIPF